MFLADLRYATRAWRKRPVLAAAAILTLALGTGANTAIFSVIHAVILRPLPYAHADRLYQVWSAKLDARGQADPAGREGTDATIIEGWRRSQTLFEQIAAYRGWNVSVTVSGQPLRLYAAAVSANFLSTLGAAPAQGRDFAAGEDTPGHDDVILLSDSLRRRLFSSDSNAIGNTVRVDGAERTVIGVMPDGFRCYAGSLSEQPDLYVPVSTVVPKVSSYVIGRLAPGASAAAARGLLDAISRKLGPEDPRHDHLMAIRMTPLQQEIGSRVRPMLLVLFGATGCVLLIACANLANLTLAHIAGRQKELLVRAALGATRARIIRQVLTESVTLSIAGCALGLALSGWLVKVLIHLYPGKLPRVEALGAGALAGSPVVLLFSVILTAATGILAGLLPAWRFSRADLQEGLKDGALSHRSRRGSMVRASLIAAQVAAAFVLLIGAGLLLRSFLLLRAVDPGYRAARLLTAQIVLPEKLYPKRQQRIAFVDRFLERVRAIPGVESAAVTNSLPLAYNFLLSVEFTTDGGVDRLVGCRAISPAYFHTMGIPVLAGRAFETADSAAGGVTIVNQEFARKYFNGANPVGRSLRFGDLRRTIVGVVADVKNRNLDGRTEEEIYLPYAQMSNLFMDVAVRTASDPASLVGAVRNQLHSIDPDQPLSRVQTMEQVLDDGVAPRRFEATLLGTLASLALLLALVGIYGVISYSVSLATREIGIRMALGAQRTEVLRWMLRRGILPVLIGVAVGIPASLAAARALESWLYGIRAVDSLTYIAAAAVMLLVSVLAAYVPARRATAIDPLLALRYE